MNSYKLEPTEFELPEKPSVNNSDEEEKKEEDERISPSKDAKILRHL